MKAEFYDRIQKTSVYTQVTDKTYYTLLFGKPQWLIEGKTHDGRRIVKFVTQTEFDNTTI
jgi:hypothetical protein